MGDAAPLKSRLPLGFSTLLPVVASAGGQAVWAAGQMAVLILLSHMGLQRLVGIYSLGLGVFTVVTLLLGLNLRVAISTDRSEAIGLKAAVAARTIACFVALPLAIAAMWAASAGPGELAVSAMLLASRIPDQLSDVVTGFYLRDNRQALISRSFMLRGSVTVAVVALSWILGWTVLTMAGLMLAAAGIVTLGHDVLPETRLHRGEHSRPLSDLIRATRGISAYPALDSLHVNSLRFVLVATTGPAFYGLVAIAQLLYTPFQILMNALGFSYLRNARRAHEVGGERALWNHVLLGLVLGGLIGIGFVITCLALPDFLARLLFADKAGAAAEPLKVAAIALGAAPLCGFLSLCVVTGENRRSYLAAPVFGLALVWIGTALVMVNGSDRPSDGENSAVTIAWIFAGSFLLRVVLSSRALAFTLKGGRRSTTGPGEV